MLKRLLLVVMALLSVLNVGWADPLPRVEVEQPIFDFGEVLQGETVVHTFVFRNVGDAMLMIDRVKSTCGCTGVLLSEKEIPPGGSGTVKATFNSGRFRGHVMKRILLYSNNPGVDPVTFTVKGTVILPLEVQPDRIDLGGVTVGVPKTVTAELINRSGKPLTLANLRTSNTAFRAEVTSNNVEINGSTELRVIAEPDATTISLRGEVFIRLGESGGGEIRIPVSGRVVAAAPGEK
jgi:hypothetical protein